jgi:hypothetical protein
MPSHPSRLRFLLFAAALVLLPAGAHAQGEEGEPGTLVLPDLDHPLNGTWRVVHSPGTMVCPGISMAMPGGNPETVTIAVHDGGHRLEMSAPTGRMTMRSVPVDPWVSEVDGDMQILRREVRDEANWFAWAVEGSSTVYEGFQNPTPGITIHFIMGFNPEDPRQIPGHLSSTAEGCRITRGFTFTKQ